MTKSSKKIMPDRPLPTVHGVSSSCLRLPDGQWNTILDYLEERFPDIDASVWISRMDKGEVVDEKGARLRAKSPYQRGIFVYYYRELKQEAPIPFQESIVYLNEHIVVADKPHFLPVTPSGRFLRETLLVRLKNRLGLEHLVPIHRIDRETAGIVIFSHNPITRPAYAELFNKHKTRKTYEALAPTIQQSHFPITRSSRLARGEPFYCMKEVEGLPNSITTVDVLRNLGNITLYRLTPITGKKHQIRVHCAALSIPIINDKLYPTLQPFGPDDFSKPLQLLARSVSFQDPLTAEHRFFESTRALA